MPARSWLPLTCLHGPGGNTGIPRAWTVSFGFQGPLGDDFCKGGADNWVQCRYPESEGLNLCPQAEPALTQDGAIGQWRSTNSPGCKACSDFSHQLHPGLRRAAHTQTLPHTEGYIFPSQQESICGVQRSAGIWQEIIVPHEAFTKHLL